MIMLFISIHVCGQVQYFKDIPKDILKRLDTMGIDSSSLLNSSESTYFNVFFENTRKDFNFTNKKIGFITGSNGRTLSNKINYFRTEKGRFERHETPNNNALYIFDLDQKKRSGGYDAVIVYWSKVLIPIDKMVERLKRKN
ncbi:MAG: hypothetical protein KUL85_09995 [Sphingobacterium mizutaii]|nr:hypothetical protein [Sphingobacterium mizutaii]